VGGLIALGTSITILSGKEYIMGQEFIKTQDAEKADISEVLAEVSGSKEGLSSSEAKQRLEQYGPNEILERKVNPILKFLGYFWGPIPVMIEVAAILSAIIRHWEDFGIIFALLLINSVVAFWQEHKADNAVELLKKKLSPTARVRRDGKWAQIPAKELVPGDIVRVRLGDIIPADIKLADGDYLQADESALTGESLPVEKSVSDVAYAGSVVRQGEMDGLVVNTGMNTYFGKTTRLVGEAKTKSHFQRAIVKIGDYLIVSAVILVAGIFLVSIFRHESILGTLQFALVLTVAAIPAALPAVLSVTMTIGAIALSRKQAIVSKLVSIEEMAGMDILCSDKTGTITQNELTVGEVKAFNGFMDKDVILFGSLASREEDQDPIDNAIITKARNLHELDKTASAVEFKPFDPVSKRTEATIEDGKGQHFKVSKGATQAILSLVANKDDITDQVNEIINSFAEKGYRALGVAKADANSNWIFAGLIGLYDPPREDSEETIKTAQSMGVNVKMVTGDHAAIAKEIAKQVDLSTNVILPESFLDKPDRRAQRVVEAADGFAQVFPEHKYHIVELLQGKEHIVGMTGDGVNDAPALKKADVGIAVAGATDAAKSSADIVLTQPGLSVITDAIKESRKIFQRMTNYSIYRISETIRVLLFITTSIVVFKFYPVTPLMIVLLAILNDLPIMTIAYDNVRYPNEPERWNMRTLLGIATLLGFLGVLQTFGLLYIGLHAFKLNHEILQSFIYLKLSLSGHLLMFMARTKRHFWSIKPAKSLFIAIITTQIVATLITVYGILLPAMGWRLAGIVWGYCLLGFVIIDFAKIGFYKLLDHTDIRFRR
jgi:H+-transporting ATPase